MSRIVSTYNDLDHCNKRYNKPKLKLPMSNLYEIAAPYRLKVGAGDILGAGDTVGAGVGPIQASMASMSMSPAPSLPWYILSLYWSILTAVEIRQSLAFYDKTIEDRVRLVA